MERNGIEMIVNLSGGHSPRSIRNAHALSRALAGRIVHFYTPDWGEVDEPWWGVREAQRLAQAVQVHGYRGLKISKALGLYLRDRAGVLIDVDDPRLDPLWHQAGLLGIPISIHTGDPRAFWFPSTPDNERHDELSVHPEWSFYGRPVPSREELLKMRERVIERHPLTTFVCVHFANNPEDLNAVRSLLTRFSNVWVDIAARVPEIGRHPAAQVRRLFIDFQDRILFGTDIGISPHSLMLGSTGDDQPTDADADRFYETHWRFLETADRHFEHPTPIQGRWRIDGIELPADVLAKIYRENARRLLGRRVQPQRE